ncbi:MAG: D-erythro-7,8-dihydroneopterin triphosphate epimerase [Candidatus Parcubacteria bacterium]
MQHESNDAIFLHNIRVRGAHGVNPHERVHEQDFLVSITALCDTQTPSSTDNLDDAVDYVTFETIVKHVIKAHSYYLIERLASVIATEILKNKKIQSVTVEVQKPSVLAPASAGVRITRVQTNP